MLLQQELDQLSAGLAQQVPAQVLAAFGRAIQEMKVSGIEQNSLRVGDSAPRFSLPAADGKTVTLSGLLAQGPVVLNFYRGLWCPYCNLELAALQKSLATIEGLNATLVAVSPQTPEASAATASKLGLSFKVLVDQGNKLAREFGLVFTLSESLRPIYAAIGIDLPAANGDNSFMLPMPATYIIARDGAIAYAFVDADYTRRMEPNDMCAVLERLKSA